MPIKKLLLDCVPATAVGCPYFLMSLPMKEEWGRTATVRNICPCFVPVLAREEVYSSTVVPPPPCSADIARARVAKIMAVLDQKGTNCECKEKKTAEKKKDENDLC